MPLVVSHKLQKSHTNILLEGQPIPCLIDAGCSTNILNLHTYRYLKKFKQLTHKKSKVSLVTYGENAESTNLKSFGTISCLAESNNRFAEDEFFVVNTVATNLIGGNLALKLNLLTLNINNVVTDQKHFSHKINKETTDLSKCTNNLPDNLNKIIAKYEHVFTGIGRFKGDKIKLHINKDVKPVAQKPRCIPFKAEGRRRIRTAQARRHN